MPTQTTRLLQRAGDAPDRTIRVYGEAAAVDAEALEMLGFVRVTRDSYGTNPTSGRTERIVTMQATAEGKRFLRRLGGQSRSEG